VTADIGTLFKKYRPYILAAIIYLLLAFVRFPSITLNITHLVPGASGDTYQNLWDIWWVNYALFNLHTSIFHTNLLFWPIGSNLAFQTMSPIGSLLSYPFQIVGVPFAYNALFFLGFSISGLCMFILADYFVKNKYAAFVAGLIFSFSAFHIAEAYAHLDWIFIGWVPLAIYFFLRMANNDGNKTKLAAGLGISFVLAVFMGDVEQGIILLIALFFILIFYLLNEQRRTNINKEFFKTILISAVIAFILGSWGFITLISAVLRPGNLNIINSYNTLSADVAQSYSIFSFFLPSFYNGYLPQGLFMSYYRQVFSISPIERTGYITYVALILCIVGVYKNWNKTKLWVALAIIFGLLALGPHIQTTSTTKIPGPYILLHAIPIINIIQEPGRFGVILFAAIAIMAAYGTEKLFKAVGNKSNAMLYGVVIFISIIFLIETLGSPITSGGTIVPTTTNATIPSFYSSLQRIKGNFSVLQLPTISAAYNLPQRYPGAATYYTTVSHKPILGGYITRATLVNNEYLNDIPLVVEASNLENYNNAFYASPIDENYTRQTLLNLYNDETLFVVLDTQAYSGSVNDYLYSQLNTTFGAPVYSDSGIVAFNTQKAVNSTIYRYFVELPAIGQWIPVSFNYFNTNVTAWSPINAGEIAVYAPYSNKTNITADIKSNQQYTENAILQFDAVGTGDVNHLEIFEQVGLNAPVQLASTNVSSNTITQYTLDVPGLVAGKLGNSLLFIASKNSTYSKENGVTDVFIENITLTGTQ
jgi:hypothetical protein